MVCPGRLFLGLKRLLGNPAIDRIFVFNRPYRLVALLTPVLLRLHEAVEKELLAPVSQAHVGRPVNFEGSDPSRNTLAVDRLTEACAYAGFRSVEFYPEPIAATLSFLWQRQRTDNGTVLTWTSARNARPQRNPLRRGKFEVLSTAGADLGATASINGYFADYCSRCWVTVKLGRAKSMAAPLKRSSPSTNMKRGFLNWAITHTLNQNRYKTRLTELVAVGNAASVKFQRLKDLIKL